MNVSKPLSVAFALVASTVCVSAQQHISAARGFDPKGVFSFGEIDAINLFNGNVVVTLPLGPEYPVGGGLSYRLTLVSNSNLWTFREICVPTVSYEYLPYNHYYANAGGGPVISIDGVQVPRDAGNGTPNREDRVGRDSEDSCFDLALPNPAANAGMGWQLTLGQIYPAWPIHAINPGDPIPLRVAEGFLMLYVGPDGAEHAFFPHLHAGVADSDPDGRVWYTRDGSYLRMKTGAAALCGLYANCIVIESPDGTSQVFQNQSNFASQPDWRMVERRDAWGQWWLRVTYGANLWTIQDRQNRVQTILFENRSAVTEPFVGHVVTEVRLQAQNDPSSPLVNRQLRYNFAYEDQELARACPSDYGGGFPSRPRLPRLVQLTASGATESSANPDIPGLLTWSMSNDFTGSDGLCKIRGALTSVTLPTGGRIEWEYGGGYIYPTASGGRRTARWNNGVRARKWFAPGAAGTPPTAVWHYDPQLERLPISDDFAYCWRDGFPFDKPDCHERVFKNRVTDPENVLSIHYFSVFANPIDDVVKGWSLLEYGLPLNREFPLHDGDSNLANNLYLSSEIFSAAPYGILEQGRTLLRQTYVRYEHDTTDILSASNGYGAELVNNPRRAAERTIFFDDDNEGGVFRHIERSLFDGLGHYRQNIVSGNFTDTASPARTSFTRFNPTRGNFPGSFQMPHPNDPWVLDAWNEAWTKESVAGVVQQAWREACFERNGDGLATSMFLTKSRTLRSFSGTRSPNDVVVAATRTPQGDVDTERLYGGDSQPLPVDETCEIDLNALTPFSMSQHQYQSGVRSRTEIKDPCISGTSDSATILVALDQTIDARTGRPESSRDSAGVATTFAYDALGRTLTIEPAGEAKISYQYLLSPTQRQVITSWDSPSLLARQSHFFDEWGRLSEESLWMPNPVDATSQRYAQRQIRYRPSSWLRTASTWRYGNDDFQTAVSDFDEGLIRYDSYDAFGRPLQVTAPDGTRTTTSYLGERHRQTTVKVATGANGVLENAVRREYFDVHGRLASVAEPSGASGAMVTTEYTYDVGNRLIRARTVSDEGVTQVREFAYDGRGFMTAERHPEIGPTGNGWIDYVNFDARGNAGRKTIRGTDRILEFRYDTAGRLLEVSGPNLPQPLKQFFYSRTNTGALNSRGKLVEARRYNPGPNVTVSEKYAYLGRGGRMSTRITETSLGHRFEQAMTYTALGNPESIRYPECKRGGSCTAATPARTVSQTYRFGFLTGVTGFSSGLEYAANGRVVRRQHGNQVLDREENDPVGMTRPRRIWTEGVVTTPSGNFDSGNYEYDGAGNIWGIGAARYRYDKVNRLVAGTLAGGASETLSYDAFGNLLTRGVAGSESPAPFNVNSATNRLAPTNPAEPANPNVAYDAGGNLTLYQGDHFVFDLLDTMESRTPAGGQPWVYLYTPGDERLAANRNGFTRWTLRGFGNEVLRVLEQDAAGIWTSQRDYVYEGSRLLASIEGNGDVLHYHLDHLGSTRLVTNQDRQAVARHDYLPFGQEVTLPGQHANTVRFTGHERDDLDLTRRSDDLDYMHARYSSPSLARFLSVDPVGGNPGQPQGWNRFALVRGNPVKFIDSSGRKEKPFDSRVDLPRYEHRNTATPIDRSVPQESQTEPYNCHSAAWHGTFGDPDDSGNRGLPPRWDNSPADDMAEATKLDPEAPNLPGDIVVYGADKNANGKLDPGEIDHSATVILVDKVGNTTRVESKEGQTGITDHHPSDQNPSYGRFKEWYRRRVDADKPKDKKNPP
jgi:RHS repeat-associated protein